MSKYGSRRGDYQYDSEHYCPIYGACPTMYDGIVKDLGPVNEHGLLYCPFCGTRLEIITPEDMEGCGSSGYGVHCPACGISSGLFSNEKDAISFMNRRNE